MQFGLYLFQPSLQKKIVGIWHIVSEDSSRDLPPLAFPADYLHPAHCHARDPSGAKALEFRTSCGMAKAMPFQSTSRSVGYSDLPAYSQILLRLANLTLGPL
jgi:hypothetical protein